MRSTNIFNRAFTSGLIAGMFALTLGCGAPTIPMSPVSGTIYLDDKPLTLSGKYTSGTVTFVPESGGTFAYGDIQADGTYRLTTVKKHDGASPGQYRVMVVATQYESDSPEAAMKVLVPEKYASDSRSGLTAEVQGNKENVIDLKLVSKAAK